MEGSSMVRPPVRRRQRLHARAAVRLARLEVLCATGAYDAVVADAEAVARTEPWNEPLHRVIARAHYGRGDQVTALQVLADVEQHLRNDLGLDLGTSSQWLREQILRQEPALDLPNDTRQPAAPTSRLAARIVGYRSSVGHFRTFDELGAVPGVSERMLEVLRTRAGVEGDAAEGEPATLPPSTLRVVLSNAASLPYTGHRLAVEFTRREWATC